MLHAVSHCVLEIAFTSDRLYANPLVEAELDAIITGPDGAERTVPCFWAGDDAWKLRFAPEAAGTYQYRTVCTDADNAGLNGRSGTLEASPYTGDNPLLAHGRLRAADDRTHMTHADGTPFFWLGDTWWFGLCRRMGWPEEFQQFAARRVRQGFNVVQVVAGLYPDVPTDFDPRGANEAGYPLSDDFSAVNPAYFDMADLRIAHLVRAALVPVIVGAWGFWLPVLGAETMRRFWRYLVARWGALPVVWCLAGEGNMPFYLSRTRDADSQRQREGWSRIAAYVRQIDGHRNPIAIHPDHFGRQQVNDPTLLDMDFLQTGHSGYRDVPNVVEFTRRSVAAEPRMPVLVDEANYEGILGHAWQDVQRNSFWMAVLSGSCGFTYGANGIWQVNRPSEPFGPSPHGNSWGDTPWQDADRLAGADQVGLGARFLRTLEWWGIEPHDDWVADAWSRENCGGSLAAGIPGRLRLVYNPLPRWDPPQLTNLPAGVAWRASWFDPIGGGQIDAGLAEPDENGCWTPPRPRVMHDWVLVLQAVEPAS